MAGSFSDYTENKVLDHVVGKTSFTMPSAYLALFTVAPTDAGGGTEVSGGAYARKLTAGADWTVAAAGSSSNATVLTFVTASANWGTIVAAAVMDAASAGNMLIWGDLTVSKVVNSGDTLSFPIGNIVFTLS